MMNLILVPNEKLVFPHFLYPNDHLTFIIFSSGNEKSSNLFQSVASNSTKSLGRVQEEEKFLRVSCITMVGASPLKMRYCRTPHLEPTVFFPIFQIMAAKVPQSAFVPLSPN